MKNVSHFAAAWLAAALGLCAASPTIAQQAGTKLAGVLGSGAYANGTLTVLSDSGFNASVHSNKGVPGLADLGPLPDGDYTYQASAATDRAEKAVSGLDNGRDKSAPAPRQGVTASGTFKVVNGTIVAPDAARSSTDDKD